MSFDAVFEQPEIIADLDDLAFEITTYSAVATRTGSVWSVYTRDLPGGRTVRADAPDWREAERVIGERVPEHLGVDRSTVVVSVEPADPEANAALRTLTGARIARARAEQAERDAARHAARLLAGQGWTAEDTAAALRLPADRVARLLTPAADRG